MYMNSKFTLTKITGAKFNLLGVGVNVVKTLTEYLIDKKSCSQNPLIQYRYENEIYFIATVNI